MNSNNLSAAVSVTPGGEPAFDKIPTDEARIRQLPNRIHQRELTVTELKMGQEFITGQPAPEPLQSFGPAMRQDDYWPINR